MQPMYSPAVNYNTEFPQLGSVHRPQVSTEHQPRPLPQHIHGPWTAPSGQTGLGYGHPDTMMAPFNPNHVGPRSTSAVYMHSPQYPCQRPVGLPFIHHHEHFHQAFSQVKSYWVLILIDHHNNSGFWFTKISHNCLLHEERLLKNLSNLLPMIHCCSL